MRFSRDRRGQSVVIGTVILFGFLILALSLYQVQIVPQENAQVEFQHFEDVRNDLVELTAGISTAGQADTPQFKTVELGTNYPNRLFAINPPAPAGTIQTSPEHDVTISNATTTVTLPSRFLQYRPGYNELGRSPTWYDASVLYLDERSDGGDFAVIEDQSLVENETVYLTVLQNEFRRSGTGSVNVELYPTETTTVDKFPTGELNVTVPTRLNGTEYWDEELGSRDVYEEVETNGYESGVHKLNLTTNSTNLRLNTVGIQSPPNEERTRQNVRSPTSSSHESDSEDDEDTSGDDISVRVDDVTDRQPNRPGFYVSYDVEGQFDAIDVSARSTESSASAVESSTDDRGGVLLQPGFGDGQEFEITVEKIADGSVVDSQTILTDADTRNPAGNADLSLLGSAALDSSDIRDQTQVTNNNVRYRFDYGVSQSGSFSEVRLYALNKNRNGGSDSTTITSRTVNNERLNPGNGRNTEYKLAILVLDEDGAVVDSRIVDDTADNTGP